MYLTLIILMLSQYTIFYKGVEFMANNSLNIKEIHHYSLKGVPMMSIVIEDVSNRNRDKIL